MNWQATSHYQPFVSPKKRLMLAGGMVLVALVRCVAEYFTEEKLGPSFYLYAGFAFVLAIMEWKEYNRPHTISLVSENGRLVYSNLYTHEQHTVYQSRTHWIKEEADAYVFYGESSISIRIPVKYFTNEQRVELKQVIQSWNKKLVDYGA
jgi:hypothetical protein